MTPRLSAASLSGLPSGARPAYDPAGISVGIVHLGIGAFHRAHQAVYTDDALACGAQDWGICGVSPRSRGVTHALTEQDGLYAVLERGSGEPVARVVGSVREVLCAADEPGRLHSRMADPRVRVVSLTVTEKAYTRHPVTGRLRTEDPEVAADLAGREPRTVIGHLVAGLTARRAADAGPVTVLCCDNLPSNGRTVRDLVLEFCHRRSGNPLAHWVNQNVTFPSTVVDRIVPATRDEDRDKVRNLLGVRDLGTVVAEPFSQWVIEDAFAAGEPGWAAAGARFTDDVAPYEAAKLTLVNGTHSALAYMGLLAGHDLLARAAADDALAAAARHLMDEVRPTLTSPVGIDLMVYADQVLERFANPAIAHRCAQVAQDGSQKLHQRLLDPARRLLAAGTDPHWTGLAVAAWMCHVARAVEAGTLDDPLANRLAAVVAAAVGPTGLVDGLLGVREVFGEDLPASATFRTAVLRWAIPLVSGGIGAALDRQTLV